MKKKELKIVWCDHISSGEWKRVWFSDWTGDQFEVINAESFRFVELLCDRFEIPLEQQED